MNIFRIYDDPEESARHLCDTHCNKMLVESLQLLATCFTLEQLADEDCPRTQKGTSRRHFNPKHPSAVWTRESTYNMDWVIFHTMELSRERIRRGMNPHFSELFLNWVIKNADYANVPENTETPFRVAINDNMNCRKVENFTLLSPETQYKLYYRLDKPFATWKQNRPKWMDYTPKQIIETYE